MSTAQRVRGVRILKAVSSPLRLQILNLLFDKGPLSYTELMSSLKMNPSRDAGRFAYHLKFLLKADLLEADVEARKYRLTDLGKMVIDVADRIDKKAFKRRKTLVRTSRLALEEFDVNKIAGSLIREASMPAELAQKVAKEAEKQLARSKIKYLTAPLVREVVNAILIDKGLEEYRHKLTRLGIPVHDVTSLIEMKNKPYHSSASVQELAGATVFKEYTLLTVFPRDISDAHLSGSIHIDSLHSWVLKPSEIMHDLRFFLEKGLDLSNKDPLQPYRPPPQDLESALSLAFDVLLHSAKEVETSQTIDYFNVLLAPFIKETELGRMKDEFRLFITSLAQHAQTSLCLELSVPDFLAGKPAYGPGGKTVGTYADFAEQAQTCASAMLEALVEESKQKPFHNTAIIVKIRPETFSSERSKALLLKSHSLAAETGTPYFANLALKDWKCTVMSSSGVMLKTDFDGDWEIDTLRTGCLGTVTINMPRIAYEAGKDPAKFVTVFKERIEMANRALEIKLRALKRYSKNLLPFITQGEPGDQYFRLEHCSRIVNIAGLKESIEAFSDKSIMDQDAIEAFKEITREVHSYLHKIGRRRGRRLSLAMLPNAEASERLARADIERYGIAKTRFSGSREKPFYSTINRASIVGGKLQEPVTFGSALPETQEGGSLLAVELGDTQQDPSELLAVSNLLTERVAGLFTYDRKLTSCVNCRKTWFGLQHKCPSCGAVGTLVFYDRFRAT